ncbi:hypothetical protein ACTHAM_000235 [Cellulomonas soli]|uniref:hypothetical protein n=1 Tax=Cellulomonas soli TaxID=931535 RepID=UPI003F827C7C
MRRLLVPWVVSVVVHVVVLVVAGVGVGAAVAGGSTSAATWVLLVLPPALGVAAGVAVWRPVTRPHWLDGALVALPVVLVGLGLAVLSVLAAPRGLPARAMLSLAMTPTVAALAAVAAGGALKARLWTPQGSRTRTHSYLGEDQA